MLQHSRRRRAAYLRWSAFPVAAALAVAGLNVATSPASASALNGIVQADVDFEAGTGCTQAPADPGTQTGPLQSDGFGSDLTVTGGTVATKTGDPTDTTSLSATVHATASATESGGEARTYDAAISGSMTSSAVKGALTACDSSNSVTMASQVYLSVTTPQLLDVRTSMRAANAGQVVVTLNTLGGIVPFAVVDVGAGQDGTASRLIEIPPGSYTMVTQLAVSRDTQDVIATPSANFAVSVHADFRHPGDASTAAKGAGTKYVTLPAALDCASHSASVGYTKSAKPAGKKKGHKVKPTLSSVTFYVDGAQVKKAKKPDRDTTTLLSGIAAQDRVTIEAVVKVRGKGTVDLRRTYLPCS